MVWVIYWKKTFANFFTQESSKIHERWELPNLIIYTHIISLIYY